jgi:tetratricopeptide (TPR) repeat protein
MTGAATHMGMQAFGEAIRNLNEANRIVPNHPKLLMRRARAFTQRGAFDEARADVRACAAQNVLSAREMHAARAEVDAAEREVRVRFLPISSLTLVLAKSRRRLAARLLHRVSTLT